MGGIDICKGLEIMIVSGKDHRFMGCVLGGVLAQNRLPEVLTVFVGDRPLPHSFKEIFDLLVDRDVEVRILRNRVEKEEFGFVNYGAFRKKTIRKAKGEYLMLLDDDNVLCGGAVEKLYTAVVKKGVPVIPKLLQHTVYKPLPLELGIRYLTGEIRKLKRGAIGPMYGLTASREKWFEVVEDLEKYIIFEDSIVFSRMKPLVVKDAMLYVLEVRVNEDVKRLFSAVNYYGWVEKEVRGR